MTILRWVITAFVGLAFLFFSTIKIFGVPSNMYQQMKEEAWDRYGLVRWQVVAIGVMELFGGATVWLWASEFSWLTQLGLGSLLIVTIGAMSFHARFDSLTKEGAPAVMQFVLSSVLMLWTIFG